MPQPFDASTLPTVWTAADAARVLAGWRASGETLPVFARRHGWIYERVRRWRSKLARDGEPASIPRLVEVKFEPAPRHQQVEPFVVELPGVRLQVPPVFDHDALAALVDIVRC